MELNIVDYGYVMLSTSILKSLLSYETRDMFSISVDEFPILSISVYATFPLSTRMSLKFVGRGKGNIRDLVSILVWHTG